MKFWVYVEGEIRGPHEAEALKCIDWFKPYTLVCPAEKDNPTQDDWKLAIDFDELRTILGIPHLKQTIPPAPPQSLLNKAHSNMVHSDMTKVQKSKLWGMLTEHHESITIKGRSAIMIYFICICFIVWYFWPAKNESSSNSESFKTSPIASEESKRRFAENIKSSEFGKLGLIKNIDWDGSWLRVYWGDRDVWNMDSRSEKERIVKTIAISWSQIEHYGSISIIDYQTHKELASFTAFGLSSEPKINE